MAVSDERRADVKPFVVTLKWAPDEALLVVAIEGESAICVDASGEMLVESVRSLRVLSGSVDWPYYFNGEDAEPITFVSPKPLAVPS